MKYMRLKFLLIFTVLDHSQSKKYQGKAELSKTFKGKFKVNSVEVDDKGRDYFDIFGAAHKWSDGAIDGANMMTDGVINGGLTMAGGALDGVNTMANGAIRGLYCLFHRCLFPQWRNQRRGGQRRQQGGQDYFDIFGAAHKLADGAIDGANIMSDGVINAGLGVAGGALNGARHTSDLRDILFLNLLPIHRR